MLKTRSCFICTAAAMALFVGARLTKAQAAATAPAPLTRTFTFTEDEAMNPPPISLEVKNGTLPEINRALEAAMKVKFGTPVASPQGKPPADLFTLSVKDKPFWEVFADLPHQQGLSVFQFGEAFSIGLTDGGTYAPMRTPQYDGGRAFFVQTVAYGSDMNLQDPGKRGQAQREVRLKYVRTFDPRMKIAAYTDILWFNMIDDLGTTFPAAAPSSKTWDLNPQFVSNPQQVSFTVAGKLGTRIVSATGEMGIQLTLEERIQQVDEIDKKVGVPLEFEGRTVVVERFDNRGALGVAFRIAAREDTVKRPGGRTVVWVKVLDSDENMVCSGFADLTLHYEIYENRFRSPFRAILSTPVTKKEVTVPIVLKNLPLP